jgi:ABC-type antimicrobial peptide transport system permease subunit
MISLRTLPLRSAGHYWRSNLPVLLGVAVAAAVLAGALVVGDSLRGSLRDRALRQLNGVEAAYIGPRLIRAELADQLPGEVVAALMLQGSVQAEQRRIGRANVIGLTDKGRAAFGLPAGVVLSRRVAEQLGAKVGDSLDIGVEQFSAVPRSSLLGKRGVEDVTESLRVKVAAVLPADHPANDFSLLPNPAPPLNVYLPLDVLQTALGQPGKANALLARSGTAKELNAILAAKLTPADWGLRVGVAPARKAYASVESAQLVLDPATVRAVQEAAKAIGARSEPTIAYLANAISAGTQPVWNRESGRGKDLIPYSVVAALNPEAAPPLGPFLPPGVRHLADDEIVLVKWSDKDAPLQHLEPGDPVTITYFKPEMETAADETYATLRFAGYLPLAGVADDPNLTPPFPGITDRLSIERWDAPFPLNRQRIRAGDVSERYWNKHRATPKAYITLKKGEELFASRFGSVTSVRVAPPTAVDALRAELRKTLDPKAAGLLFEPTRERLLTASQGGTDFAALLLMFGGLLIATALLLVGLLFRLATERRAREVGLFLAAGYSPGRVRRLLLTEGVAVALLGSLLGLVLAVGYARLMLFVLIELWPDAAIGQFLRLHVQPLSLVIGFFATVLVAALTIWLSVRGLVKVAPPALLRGETATAEQLAAPPRRPWVMLIGATLATVLGVALLLVGGTRSNPDERSMCFFSGGGLLLAAGLLFARAWLHRPHHGTITSRGAAGLAALGSRNAGRNAARSLLTAALIAISTFLVVSVESFRRKPDEGFLNFHGGSGGFRLIAESAVPIFQPFDRPPGKGDLLDRLQEVYQREEARNPAGPSRQELLKRAEAELADLKAIPLRLRGGDDASCLNLYKANQPRVLGVPDELIERGGFQFGETLAKSDAERADPWVLLREPQPDGAIPVFAEQNSAMFMLRTSVGGTFTTTDENGSPVTLRLVGVLQDSPFQSEVLLSDDNFRKLYPRTEGFRVFLIDVPAGEAQAVAGLLETGFRASGLTVTPTRDKVAAYQAVVGAYLTTFQLLGGLALLLAVLGLGVVILRSVWERAGELALLRAVGYRTGALQTMILSETLLVLALGLLIGVVAAVASVLPNLALGGAVPWPRLVGLLVVVAVAGVAVAGLATGSVARMPLIPALRKD